METAIIYLVYSDDGALLRYAGQDVASYEAACAQLAPEYAGSLIGRRAVGPTEQWVVRSFFRAEPSPAFIAARRGSFRFRLDWERAGNGGDDEGATGETTGGNGE